MDDQYLPEIYQRFREDFPDVAGALDGLGAATEDAGPLDPRTQRLVTLGIAIGAGAEGAVRSNVRRGLGVGLSGDELRHVAMLAVSTAGFPAAIAGLRWIDEVLEARSGTSD